MPSKETSEMLAHATKHLRYENGCLFHTTTKCSIKEGQRAGSTRSDGYRDIRVKGIKFLEHRVIWAICTGAWPADELDHIDRNPSNNRIENLRLADRFINNANTSKRSTNNSGHKHIYWNKVNKRWRVAVRIFGRRYNLGSHLNLIDAISARDNFLLEIQHASCTP